MYVDANYQKSQHVMKFCVLFFSFHYNLSLFVITFVVMSCYGEILDNNGVQMIFGTTAESGEVTPLSNKTLQKYRDEYGMPHAKIGTRYFYIKSDLIKWIKDNYGREDKKLQANSLVESQ